MDNIKVKHTSIIIPNYTLGQNIKLENLLSKWDDVRHKYDPIAVRYDEEKKELLIPRGIDLNYLERHFKMNIEIDYKPDEYATVSYRLKVEPRDDTQRQSISFLLGKGDFAYTKQYSQLALTLPPGEGKTYCAIAALSFMRTKAIIISHTKDIRRQWIKSIKKNLVLDDAFIYNIDGSDSIDRILEAKTLPFKIYFVCHGTLNSYGKKHGWDSISKLFNKLEVGLKIYDEAHFYFENIVSIDLHTNTKKTFYLTANFERSEYKQNTIFNLCFKNIAKFGEEVVGKKRKHVIYIAVLFDSHPSLADEASVRAFRGFFSAYKYIEYELKQDIFYEVIEYIQNFFKDKEGKTLLLLSKIEATEIMNEFYKENFSEKTIGLYNSEITEKDKIKSLESDIIISTPKSLGTGMDMPGLRFNIMTEPYISNISINQIIGRLREYGPDDYTFYIEPVDIGFKKVYDMYKKRQKVIKTKCAKALVLKFKEGKK